MSQTSLRLRVVPRYPAKISATDGIKAVRSGVDLVVKSDYSNLVQVPDVTNPDRTFMLAWDADIDNYQSMSFTNVVNNIQDAIIGPPLAAIDAANPGADQAVYFTGEGEAATYTVSSYLRGISNVADANALRAAIGASGEVDIPIYATADGMNAIAVPEGIGAVRTNGQSAAGDGHDGLFVRSVSEPATDKKFQSQDGAWWGLAEAGRSVGDILRYENFGGFPAVQIDSRIILRKPIPTLSDVWNVAVLRSTGDAVGGTSGFVNSAFVAATTVDGAVSSFEWNALFQLTVNAAGSGEHTAAYSQGVKNADAHIWAHTIEARDNVVNPATGTLGMEVGMFVNGTDIHGSRHAIDISIGSTNSLPGTNIVTNGIRIGPTSGNSGLGQFVNGISIGGRGGRGIDLSLMDISYSDIGIGLAANHHLVWYDGSQNPLAALSWQASLNTWQITGVKAVTSASGGAASPLPSNPNRYLEFQINGDTLVIPAYGA